jgi:hypothetical protein
MLGTFNFCYQGCSLKINVHPSWKTALHNLRNPPIRTTETKITGTQLQILHFSIDLFTVPTISFKVLT